MRKYYTASYDTMRPLIIGLLQDVTIQIITQQSVKQVNALGRLLFTKSNTLLYIWPIEMKAKAERS